MAVVAEGSTQAKSGERKRVLAAGLMGTTIEYYDFFIYGTAAALVFPKIFFPALGSAAGTAASFATFGVAFLARPLGGVLFGLVGDRVGRKVSLVVTMLLMGSVTVLIGLLPASESIGMVAPILLVTLRFIQGLAIGGEFSSAAIFVGEFAPKGKRGLYGLSPTLGSMVGLLLATGVYLVIGLTVSDESFTSWGWRIPFLLSALLVLVGLWVRLGVSETPVFREAMMRAAQEKQRKAPVVEMFRHQGRELFLAAGVVLMWLSFFYIGAVYLTNYGTEVLGVPRNSMLTANVIAVLFCMAGGVVGARWSDQLGRRKVMLIANSLAVVWAFALFPLMDTGNILVIGVAMSVTLLLVGMANGVTTPLLPEIFRTSYRSTAMGFSFNLGSIVGGAIPPILAAPLFASYGSIGLSVMLAVLAGVSVLAGLKIRETSGSSLAEEG